ncbi:MAG: hypothetical protein AAF409_07605 [Pseudomonadota bacterium]
MRAVYATTHPDGLVLAKPWPSDGEGARPLRAGRRAGTLVLS